MSGYRERVKEFEEFMGYGEYARRARRDTAARAGVQDAPERAD
jgi:hypothetical protein